MCQWSVSLQHFHYAFTVHFTQEELLFYLLLLRDTCYYLTYVFAELQKDDTH
jgi:hypothetical protein